MAQVRKYAKGNTIVKAAGGEPLLFTWDGYGDYDVADLEKTYAQNAENYVKSLGLNEEDSKKVLDRSYAILQAMKNGQIKNRNARGQWTNVPVGFESTGINEKGREKWWKRKDYVRDADFYNNLGYNIMDQVLRGTSTYIKPTNTTGKSTFNTNFGKYLSKYYFNNENGFDRGLWDFTNARTNIGARLSDWRKEVEASDLDDKTKTDLLSRIDAGLAGLQSETTDDDYAALARLGFDARQWIDKDYVPSTSTEQPLTEEQKKQQQFADTYKTRVEDWNNKWKDQYQSWSYNPYSRTTGSKTIQDSTVDPYTSIPDFSKLSNINDIPNLARQLHSYLMDPEVQSDYKNKGYFKDGWYYLPDTQDITTNMLLRVNPSTQTIERVPFTSFEAGKSDFEKRLQLEIAKELGIVQPWTTSIPSNKQGGILKAQLGSMIESSQSILDKRKKKSGNNDKQKTSEKASSVKRVYENKEDLSKEEIANRSKVITDDNISSADRARLASIYLDIASAGSAYVPVYGTAISALTGLGSTIANTYSDIKQGNSLGNTIGNTALGLGLDLVGLIPGLGTAAKASKIAKALKGIMGSVAVANAIYQNVEAKSAYDKLMKGEDMTAEDWRNLAYAIGSIAGISRLGAGAIRNRQYKNKYSTLTKTNLLTTKSGKQIEVSDEMLSRMKKAKGLEEQNKLLQEIAPGESLQTEFNNWRRPVSKQFHNVWNGTPDIETVKERTWNPINKIDSEGNIYIPKWYTNKGLYSKTSLLDLGVDTPDWYKTLRNKTQYIGYTKQNPKPEANVGSNKIVDDVNKATEEWEKRQAALEEVYKIVTERGRSGTYKRGGILKAANGTTLRDVSSTANWANQIYGTDAYFNWLKSFNTNNYQDFNNYQKGWNANYLKSNYNPTGINKTGNIAYSQNVWNSQGIFNKQANGVNQVIEGLANNGVITRRGNSGDNAARNFQDGYFGGQEYLRHGGMESMLTPEQVAEINKNVNPNGLEYYFDPTTKMGFLRPIQQATKSTTFDPLAGLPQSEEETPELQGTTSQQIIEELVGPGRTGESGGLQTNSGGTKPQINWGDILGTARLAGTIWTNNRIAKGLKESLSPLLLDPVQLRRQVTGDLVTRNYMENLGAEANRIGARPITSDASLQLGQALDFNNRANEYRVKGYLADKQAIDKTTAEAQKVADFNKEQRVDVANRNRAAMLGIRQAKANIEAQRKSANWQQAIAPWLADKEMRWRENQKLNQALNYQENQYLYGDQYEQAAKAAQSVLDNAKSSYLSKEGNTEEGWLTSPENTAATKIYQSTMEEAAKNYRNNMLKARKQAYTYNPFLFTFKSGGQLTYKEKSLLQQANNVNKAFMNDRKLFHKMITDSQKENNKLIMSLGSLTKDLIIKSMTYAG